MMSCSSLLDCQHCALVERIRGRGPWRKRLIRTTTTRISTLALSLQSAIYTRYVYKHIALSAGVCLYNINLPAASKPPPLQVKSDSRLYTFAWDGLGTRYFTPLLYIFTKIPIHSSNLPLGPHSINRNSSDSTHLCTGRMESGSSTCTMLKRSVLTLAYC